jgi:hypothetical protein
MRSRSIASDPATRPPTTSPRRSRLRGGALAILLALGLSACGTAEFAVHDVRLSPSGNTLYILARNQNVSRNLCATLGGDVARAEGRLAAADTRTMRLGRVGGCYTPRHIIVCPEGDAECLAHEERHRDQGNFHD